MSKPNVAFTLRIRLYRKEHDPRLLIITAYDHNWSMADTHGRIDVEVKHGGEVIFPLGQLYCAVSKACGHSSDGMAAKELVMSLVAMHRSAGGGEGEDYYYGYTPVQIQWSEAHGQALDVERMERYCDQNGEVRKPRRSPKYDTLHIVATAAAMRMRRTRKSS